VVVVCDGRPEEEGYCVDSQEELAEHFEGHLVMRSELSGVRL
jgi:hypothetical protein